jgi:hypothetical protein
MKLRPVVRCLAILAMLLWIPTYARADSGGTALDCQGKDPLASARQDSSQGPDDAAVWLSPQRVQLASETSCCSYEEVQSCYASVSPESGCGISYVGCSRWGSCFCAVLCPH